MGALRQRFEAMGAAVAFAERGEWRMIMELLGETREKQLRPARPASRIMSRPTQRL